MVHPLSVAGTGFSATIDAVGQDVAAGDAARAPEPIVAPVGIIGGVGGDVPDVVGAAGLMPKRLAAVLRDVHVEAALLLVIPVEVGEGEDHVVEVGRAVGLHVFGDGEDAGLGVAAADLVEVIAVGIAEGGAETAGLVEGGIDRPEIVHAVGCGWWKIGWREL